MTSLPAPPSWIDEHNELQGEKMSHGFNASISLQAPTIHRAPVDHAIFSPAGVVIDLVPEHLIIATMANAMVAMIRAKITITERQLLARSFTPHQIKFCMTQAAEKAMWKLKLHKQESEMQHEQDQ